MIADLDTLLTALYVELTDRIIPGRGLRRRVEAIIWTLKNQLGLERHRGRVPAWQWAPIIQRLLALDAVIWHNLMVGAPRSNDLGRHRAAGFRDADEAAPAASPPRVR